MSGAELGLAIISTVDLCFKYGDKLMKLCASFHDAENELVERIVRVQNLVVRTTYQLQLVKAIGQTLEETHQRLQSQILDILVGKLKLIISRLEKVIPHSKGQSSPNVQRWKYALHKDGLDKSLDDLEAWQRMYDPSWFLIMKVASPQIDIALSNASEDSKRAAFGAATSIRAALKPEGDDKARIFLPPDGLELAHISEVPFSSVKLAQRMGSSKWLILDTVVQSTSGSSSVFTKDVRDIARKLRHADPQVFHLLSCSGIVRNVESRAGHPATFTFVFRVPEGLSSPSSLRNILMNAPVGHVLSHRFQIAKEIARAVSYVHNLGFVHKNIRPETIIMLKSDARDLGTPYLTGFEAFRSADGHTMRMGDTVWNLNIYRHPDRHGEHPVEIYVMQHDIYSLGVCLLELGLFESFVLYDNNEVPTSASTLLNLASADVWPVHTIMLKDTLLSLAQTELPMRMGQLYSDIVVNCLTCLDADNVDFGDQYDLLDEDGIVVSVRYIEKVYDSERMS